MEITFNDNKQKIINFDDEEDIKKLNKKLFSGIIKIVKQVNKKKKNSFIDRWNEIRYKENKETYVYLCKIKSGKKTIKFSIKINIFLTNFREFEIFAEINSNPFKTYKISTEAKDTCLKIYFNDPFTFKRGKTKLLGFDTSYIANVDKSFCAIKINKKTRKLTYMKMKGVVVLTIVNKLQQVFNIDQYTIYDASTIISGEYNISLARLYIFKHKKTWYHSHLKQAKPSISIQWLIDGSNNLTIKSFLKNIKKLKVPNDIHKLLTKAMKYFNVIETDTIAIFIVQLMYDKSDFTLQDKMSLFMFFTGIMFFSPTKGLINYNHSQAIRIYTHDSFSLENIVPDSNHFDNLNINLFLPSMKYALVFFGANNKIYSGKLEETPTSRKFLEQIDKLKLFLKKNPKLNTINKMRNAYERGENKNNPLLIDALSFLQEDALILFLLYHPSYYANGKRRYILLNTRNFTDEFIKFLLLNMLLHTHLGSTTITYGNEYTNKKFISEMIKE